MSSLKTPFVQFNIGPVHTSGHGLAKLDIEDESTQIEAKLEKENHAQKIVPENEKEVTWTAIFIAITSILLIALSGSGALNVPEIVQLGLIGVNLRTIGGVSKSF